MSSLLVKNALAIVTVDDKDRVLKNENILIEDGVITYIGKEARQADNEIRADGCFVYPGLVNTFIRPSRGICLRCRRWSCSPG